MSTTSHPRGTRRQPEQSRSAILHAALEEFGTNGLEGARMDAIARNAEVNKALVYYYYRDKQALYAAVLEEFMGLRSAVLAEVFESDLQAGEKLLTLARRQFEFLARHSVYPRLMYEAFSGKRLPSRALHHLVEQYIRPGSARLEQLVAEGVRNGELVAMHGVSVGQTLAAHTIFYFASAPIAEAIRGRDPLSPAAIRRQCFSVLELFANAFFVDRAHGYRTARKIFEAPDSSRPCAALKRGNK